MIEILLHHSYKLSTDTYKTLKHEILTYTKY